ncbi:MAG: site-2 protease family protein [Acidobacteriota bacterium]
MNGISLRIGQIAGINIRLHYTWLFIFALVTISLVGQFSILQPQWPPLHYWLSAIVASFLFFTSVLLHELAHSLLARRKGIPVQSITLFIFGGLASIEHDAERSQDEFSIAAVGPGMSLVLAIIFHLIAFFATGMSSYLTTIANWLSTINFGLAIFNLLPGFPMDGGRMLRALLWWRNSNFIRATRMAVLISRGIAITFIIAGVSLTLLTGEILSGLWLAFIGWFLHSIAKQSGRQAEIYHALQGLQAHEVMTTDCPQVPINLNIYQFVEDYLLRMGKRCFFVIEDNSVLGLITYQQVKAVPRQQWHNTYISEIMIKHKDLIYFAPETPIELVFEVITSNNLSQAPVVANGQVLGLIGQDTLLKLVESDRHR